MDFRAAPGHREGPVVSLYVDNVFVYGETEPHVDNLLAALREAFESAGVTLRLTEAAQDNFKCLGVTMEGWPPRVTLTTARYWKLHAALSCVLRRQCASPLQIGRLIGH